MARPKQKGLDYFPLDVSIDQDDKIALLEADYGIVGFAVAIKLFMKIYDEGYFYHWGEKELKLFARRVNLENDLVQEIVQAAFRWDLFDQNLFDSFSILTSHGIQKRYFVATSRRKDVPIAEEYLLLNEMALEKFKHLQIFSLYPVIEPESNVDNTTSKSDVDIEVTQVPLMSTLTTQSKVKQSKEKESKEKQSKASAEKRTEIKKDADDDVEIFKIYERYFKTPSKYIQDSLLKWQGVFEVPIIQNALGKAVENGKSYAYANSILKSYQQHQIKTLQDIEAYDEAFKNRFKPKGQTVSQSKEILPTWFNQPYEEKPSETVKSVSVQDRLKQLDHLRKTI